jgi:hypothetical protein
MMNARNTGNVVLRAAVIVVRDTVIACGIVFPGPEVLGGVPMCDNRTLRGPVRNNVLRHTTGRSRIDTPIITAAGRRPSASSATFASPSFTSSLEQHNARNGTHSAEKRDPARLPGRVPAISAVSGLDERRFRDGHAQDQWKMHEQFRSAPTVVEQQFIVKVMRKVNDLCAAIERRLSVATKDVEKLTQASLSKAFSGELVPTEAELANAEGRTYETAEELLARVRQTNVVQTGNRVRSRLPGRVARRAAAEPSV